MNDSRNIRGRAPLLALAAVVALLCMVAVYLVVSSRSATVPEKPVESPPPPPVAQKPAPPPSPPPTPPPAPEVPKITPEQEKHLHLVEKGRALIEERKFEEALNALKEAKTLQSTPEVDALIGKVEGVIELQQRSMMEKQFLEVLAKADELKRQNKWDELVVLYEEALKELPAVKARVEEQLVRARELRDDAAKNYENQLSSARKKSEEKKFMEALNDIRIALMIYPSRPEAKALQASIRIAMFSANMVKIPAVSATVGNDTVEDEKPRRIVSHPAFFVGACETTNEEYALFVADTGHAPPRYWQGNKPPKGMERHPVVGVSLEDASAFARWSGRRLPTDEEWEIAARYIDGRVFPWGDAFPDNPSQSVCNSAESIRTDRLLVTTVPVGSLPAGDSPYGIHDLAGNVWEWTSTTVRDKDGRELAVVKGGSFLTPRNSLRSSNRLLEEPSLKLIDVGFRCVKDESTDK